MADRIQIYTVHKIACRQCQDSQDPRPDSRLPTLDSTLEDSRLRTQDSRLKAEAQHSKTGHL